MHIVMHAGGIPFNGNTIKERSLGGSESAAYYTAKEFARRGNRVVLFTEHKEGGLFDGVEYTPMGNRTQVHPMGENWHFYCEHTPHDVNIVQRQPGSFMFHIQSKINLWWAHDIALKRNNPPFMAQMWQTDRVLPVSHWFKKQINEAWLCDPNIITPVHNGVDYSLYEQFELKDNSKGSADEITLLYSSRPERGLNNLVGENGIMQRLWEAGHKHIKLKVCGYEHPVPNLEGFYQHLRQRCLDLPNVEHLGELTKQELVKLQCEEADVWCYPTEFEEVSCITAMECMAAGMYLLTTNTAALPETIANYENVTRFNYDENVVEKFVNWLSKFNNKFRRRPFRGYTWAATCDEFETIIDDCFEKYTVDHDAVARHFLHNSDIAVLDELWADKEKRIAVDPQIWKEKELYDFRFDQKKYAEHYADGTEQMYDGEDFHYESEDFINHPRFQQIAKYIEEKQPKYVVDYGCAHGQFTNYLAKMFPDILFRGVDVSPAALLKANSKAEELGLTNVIFFEEDWLSNKVADYPYSECDLIILGEILEHVPDPIDFMNVVKDVVGNAAVIITTPFGPWESLSYEKEYPKRFHIHHFERADLEDMFAHQDETEIICIAASHTPVGELLGWYVTKFQFSDKPACCKINYARKISRTRPRQTVSFCGIVKNGEDTVLKMLKSIEPYVDEIILGIDETTNDNTKAVIDNFAIECHMKKHRSPSLDVTYFDIPSPVDVGFDKARNLVIEKAKKHWILWCDADEELIQGDRVVKYLRQNGWQGYGIPQHHFSVEPLGVLSTDYPVRLFRRNDDVRFRGVVHEHPENRNKPEDGVGFAYVLHELHFSHHGYSTEDIRRKRFARNIQLMARDREENPDRILGKFLWIRDLALMCRFDLEQTHGMVTNQMVERANEGLGLWEKTVDECGDHPQVRRMIKDHLEFYDTLVKILNVGFDFKINLKSGDNAQLNPAEELSATFLNRRHLDKFLSVVIDEEVKDYGTKYH